MATVNLRIRSTANEKLAVVHLRLKDGRDVDVSAPTNFKVYPKYWHNKSQKFNNKILFTDEFKEEEKLELENEFRKLKDHVLLEYNKRSLKGLEVSKNWLVRVINEFSNKRDVTHEDLNSFIDRFIKEAETGERYYDHNNRQARYAKSTLKNYKGFQEQFNKYQEETGKVLTYEDITIDFYDSFVMYFNNKNYSPNTIGRHIKTLKAIMSLAKEEGLHSNIEFTRKKFKAIKVQVQDIYLTEDEVKAMYDLDLSDNPELKLARDVFLVGCYTAQRYSDYSRIHKEQLFTDSSGNKYLRIIQKKTGEEVIIPVRQELNKILKRYDFTLPGTYEQKINKRIKIVGALAGINCTSDKRNS